MNPEVKNALQIILAYTDALRLTRTEHIKLQQAIGTVERALEPKVGIRAMPEPAQEENKKESIDNTTDKALG